MHTSTNVWFKFKSVPKSNKNFRIKPALENEWC